MYGALGSEPEKVEAFEQGAGDYIVKCTGISEVMARVPAVMRRSSATPSEPTGSYVDDLPNINYTSPTVAVCGAQIGLTPTEYKLLTTLVSQKTAQYLPISCFTESGVVSTAQARWSNGTSAFYDENCNSTRHRLSLSLHAADTVTCQQTNRLRPKTLG
jgi:hypothetical protein